MTSPVTFVVFLLCVSSVTPFFDSYEVPDTDDIIEETLERRLGPLGVLYVDVDQVRQNDFRIELVMSNADLDQVTRSIEESVSGDLRMATTSLSRSEPLRYMRMPSNFQYEVFQLSLQPNVVV